jgi:DNA-binding HxlR family transcriptional regulator
LEEDDFLHGEIYKEIPPKVEYTLSELGESFIPVLNAMMVWSETHLCPDYISPFMNQVEVDIQVESE